MKEWSAGRIDVVLVEDFATDREPCDGKETGSTGVFGYKISNK